MSGKLVEEELEREPKVGVKVRRKQTKINELKSKQQLLSKFRRRIVYLLMELRLLNRFCWCRRVNIPSDG